MRILVAGALFASSVGATAGPEQTTTRTHNGVTCTWRTSLGGLATCRRSDRVGYLVVVSHRLVMVQTETTKVRFWRNQPTVAASYSRVHDKLATATETHDAITCTWTARDGGGAYCGKADRHGYVVGVTQRRVWVADEGDNLVYLVLQP